MKLPSKSGYRGRTSVAIELPGAEAAHSCASSWCGRDAERQVLWRAPPSRRATTAWAMGRVRAWGSAGTPGRAVRPAFSERRALAPRPLGRRQREWRHGRRRDGKRRRCRRSGRVLRGWSGRGAVWRWMRRQSGVHRRVRLAGAVGAALVSAAVSFASCSCACSAARRWACSWMRRWYSSMRC